MITPRLQFEVAVSPDPLVGGEPVNQNKEGRGKVGAEQTQPELRVAWLQASSPPQEDKTGGVHGRPALRPFLLFSPLQAFLFLFSFEVVTEGSPGH